MKTNILVSISLIVLLAATFGWAQPWSLRANIPFQFSVERMSLPAGQYDFIPTGTNDENIRIVSEKKGGPSGMALVQTRLGKGINTTPQAHLVFDKVGDTYFLSEVWFPGIDGYLLHSTKEKHEHRTVDAPR